MELYRDIDLARKTLKDIDFESCANSSLVKEKVTEITDDSFKSGEFITMQELQDSFGISRYQLVRYLKDIGAAPLGEKKNYKNGKRTRGVGKVVYQHDVLDKIQDLLNSQTDVDAIKRMAQQILDG